MTTTTKTTRVTKAQRHEDIIALLQGQPAKYGTTIADAVSFCQDEIVHLNNKNTNKNKKPTKEQLANVGYTEEVRAYLRTLPDDSKGVTCTEILRHTPGIYKDGYGNQKIAYLCKELVKSGEAISQEIKGRVLFRLA